MDARAIPLPPPFKLVNNEYSLLTDTDLVFIDPVSTGYSRAAPGEEAKQFHGVEPGHQVGGGVHSPLHDAAPAMGVAQVPDR